MKDTLQFLGVLSGFLTAGFLAILCIVLFSIGGLPFKIISVLGILGFMGMFLLFLEHRVNKWMIIVLLICGIASCLLFLIKMNLLGRMNSMENLLTLLLILWPSLIASINIARLLNKTSMDREN
ncbi:MAG: hypothetical protein HWE22_07725 [Flavobacteriales bacterium]|nr:hypothetical protein [Flavobacteriales bacterium]